MLSPASRRPPSASAMFSSSLSDCIMAAPAAPPAEAVPPPRIEERDWEARGTVGEECADREEPNKFVGSVSFLRRATEEAVPGLGGDTPSLQRRTGGQETIV